MKSKVSIVVPVYNGEKTLSLCLDSLMNLDFPRDDLEIIVVDNNSTDTTKDIISRYPVKYVFERKKGRGAARNKGITESKGELVAFIDVDCVADRLWLMNIVKGFRDETVGGSGGEVFSLNPHTLIEKYYDFKDLFSQKRGLMGMELPLPRIATFNAIYRRDVLEEVGLFDDSFITNEDADLSWRVYLKGYQLKYVPEAIVYHKHPSRLIDFFRKWFEYGYTCTYLLQKYTNLIEMPLVSCNDCIVFFFQQLHSLGLLPITLFTGRDIVGRTFPILDTIKDVASFLGRFYGLARLRLGKEKIAPLPILESKVLWRIVDEKVIISEPNRYFHYALNNVGSKVWTLYIEGKDVSKIIDIIADEYEADKEEVKNDLINFIDELKNESLLPAGKLKT